MRFSFYAVMAMTIFVTGAQFPSDHLFHVLMDAVHAAIVTEYIRLHYADKNHRKP